MPSSNPTTGLGVAAYLNLTGTGLTNPSGGTLAHPGSNGANGQGIGATAGSGFPVAQYALPLSVSASAGLAATCQLAVTARDVSDASQGDVTDSGAIFLSYGNPAAGSPSWYRPSNGTTGGITGNTTYNANVASVSSGGLITALFPGQCIVEVQYPVFANTLGSPADPNAEGIPGTSGTATPQQSNPNEMIYVQIVVTVSA